MKTRTNYLVIIILALFVFTDCKPGQQSSSSALKKIPESFLGNFKDDYDIRYTITEKEWTQLPNIRYHILKYDSAGQYFIAKNHEKNPSEAGLYTRIDVVRFSNMEPWTWGFCLTAYKATTIEEAKATAAADRKNPKKGCGGYPFSRMKRE